MNEAKAREFYEAEHGKQTDAYWDELYLQAVRETASQEAVDEAEFGVDYFARPSDLFAALDGAARTLSVWKGVGDPEVASSKPPARWAGFQVARFTPYEQFRHDVRSRFGLDGPVEPESVFGLLEDASRAQKRLTTPHTVETVASLGADMHGFVYRLAYVPLGIGEGKGDPDAGPLAWLAHYADLLHERTAMQNVYATYYLLCEVVPVAPWISFVSRPVTARPADQWLEISVGSLAVTPEDLAAAYTKAKRTILGGTEPRFGRTSASGEDVVNFCRPRREKRNRSDSGAGVARRLTWQEIESEWNSDHPDQQYALGSLSVVAKRHAKRLGVDL